MTPTEEAASHISAELQAAIKAARDQKRISALTYYALPSWFVGWVVKLAIEILGRYGATAFKFFAEYYEVILKLFADWLHPFLDLTYRVLAQDPATYDPAVRATVEREPASSGWLRAAA